MNAHARVEPNRPPTIETLHVNELGSLGDDASFDAAVIIDVIRAFTTAPWILLRGASRLFLARDAESAVREGDLLYPNALLVKDGQPDPRFHFPNSPGMIARQDLGGCTVIQATGNGTRGAHAVRGMAPVTLCASFINATATLEAVSAHPRVLLVPTEGDEDVALAEYLTVALSTNRAPHPGPFLQRVERSPAGIECRDRGTDTRFPGVDPDDLARCLEIDAYDQALLVEEAGEFLALSGRLRHQPRAGPYERISRCALSGPRCRRG